MDDDEAKHMPNFQFYGNGENSLSMKNLKLQFIPFFSQQ